jgi:hypothetical protein
MNRGGVGIPLHKLSSVVDQAERFFQMLAEDVHIEKDRGEWLAFDFDNESLNFTAEYVGPASQDQVQAFSAAFDGTTSLRRATIAQFTRITEAIGEDEVIGFGLYHSDQEAEPGEWRCLSRRDALRIADEIQMLLGASGELDQATHLPAVKDTGMGARMFKERHDRGALAGDQSKVPSLLREVEANLSKRIARLEGDVEEHSESIRDLRDTSGATEVSFRNLLTSVETFCAQATRQLERITPPALLTAGAGAGARAEAPALAQIPEEASQPAKSPHFPLTAPAGPSTTPPANSWRAYLIAAVVIIGIVSAVVLLWSPKSGEGVEHNVSAASVTPPVETPRESVPAAGPASSTPLSKAGVMRVEIEAREAAWVAITDESGKRLLARTLEANESRSIDLTSGATLRTGNAGGLILRLNGKELGPLGPEGKIRDVSFKDGGYRIHTPDAG